MLKTLEIKGFRAFDSLRLEGLARVNLFVGRNNCGKTSVLEAVEMLGSERNSSLLLAGARRRGEALLGDDDVWATRRLGRPEIALDICHIFHGHELDGSQAELIAEYAGQVRQALRIGVEAADDLRQSLDEPPSLFPNVRSLREPIGEQGRFLVLRRVTDTATGSHASAELFGKVVAALPISPSGALFASADDAMKATGDADSVSPARFVPSSGWSGYDLLREWNQIAGSAAEDRIVKVMQIIEPRLARVLVLSPPRFFVEAGGSSGAFVRLTGADDRIPLGSMGDGLRRLLVLGVALARAAGGVLLVDEIDTGLHHTSLARLWQFLVAGASQLDVQVFATTHSSDCVRALAAVVRLRQAGADDVRVQRVEAGPPSRAISYTPEELIAATDNDLEIRGA